MVWKRLNLRPLAASRSATGVWQGPPKALAEEDLLGARLAARQVDLIARPGELAEHVEAEPLDDAEVAAAEEPERVLRRLIEVLRKAELRAGAAPGLAQAQPDFRAVVHQLVFHLAVDRFLPVVVQVVPDRVLQRQHPAGGFRIREDVVLDARRDAGLERIILERVGPH